MRSPSRYRVIRQVDAGDDIWTDVPMTMDVVIESEEPIDTGLVDEHGNKIVRLSPRVPLGFCR